MNTPLDAIRRDYEVVIEHLKFGDLAIDFCRVAEPDTMVDDDVLSASHEDLAWQPYWAQAWETAYAIAEELADRELTGCRVLDLGCGLGLTGAVAAAHGAQVVMGDFAPPALRFAEGNSWPWRERVQVLRLDWRKDRLPDAFDLIVGSDILYDRDDLPYLDAFWRAHLKPQGSILLGEPTRSLTREFLAWIRDRRWQMSETTRRISQSDRPIRLIELRTSP
jgi:predicted nicotinamide N-methyase